MLVELVRKEKEELLEAAARKEKSAPLEAYLPSEFEIQQRLSKKLNSQKEKQRKLEGLLRRAKESYDALLKRVEYLKLEGPRREREAPKREATQGEREEEESLMQTIEAPQEKVGEEVKTEEKGGQAERKRLERRVVELEAQQREVWERKYAAAVHTIRILRDEYATKLVAAE